MLLLPLQQQENKVDADVASPPASVFAAASLLTKEGTILLQKRSPLLLNALLSVRPEGLLALIVAVAGLVSIVSCVASMPENAVAEIREQKKCFIEVSNLYRGNRVGR